MSKKTKIICTIGPASESKEVLTKLVEAGMNIARLNFSHGDYEEHAERVKRIREVSKETGKPIGILLDTKGPEIRTGKFSSPEVNLVEGQNFIITMEDVLGDETKCTVSYKELVNDVKPGNQILIDDGLVGLAVKEIKGQEILCIVQNAGTIKDNKGVNVPNVKINLPAITPKDKGDEEKVWT